MGVIIDITEHRRNERVNRFLAEASANLAALGDPANTLRGVARMALPFFANCCLIDLLEDDRKVHRLAACHANAGGEALAGRLGMGDPLDLDGRLLIHRVLQSGKSEIVPRVSEELLPQLTPDFDREAIIRELRPSSLICVPLVVRSRTFGAMTFILSESSAPTTWPTWPSPKTSPIERPSPSRTPGSTRSSRTSDRRKDEFLAMLAHELRNPLAPIRNAVQLLSYSAATTT